MQRIGAIAAAALLAGCANFGDMKTTVAQQDAADAFASAAFARMQTLAGNWKGEIASGPPDVPAATPPADGAPAAKPAAAETVNVEYLVISGGHTLQEKLFAGSDLEIVTNYNLEGTDLVLVLARAVGTRPHLRLDQKSSTRDDLRFAFDVHATDVDPKKDAHIHEGRVHFVDGSTIECEWALWLDGKEASRHAFTLKRTTGKYTPPAR